MPCRAACGEQDFHAAPVIVLGMTLTLELKPETVKRLENEARAKGVNVKTFLEQELEQRFVVSEISCIGVVESDFRAEDAEIWLTEHWHREPA
jgi:hypothetical protein